MNLAEEERFALGDDAPPCTCAICSGRSGSIVSASPSDAELLRTLRNATRYVDSQLGQGTTFTITLPG